MSSGSPDNGRESPRGSEGIWHPAREWLEDDELDTDYHTAAEPSRHDSAQEDNISNEDQQMGFGVADDNPHIDIGNIHIELTADNLDESEDTDDLNEGHMRVPASRLFELLASSGLQHILQANGWPAAMGEEQEHLGNEDDELSDEDFMPIFRNRLRARRSTERVTLPPVPNPEGKKLMGEGHFGTDQFYGDRLRQRKKFLTTSLMWRELGVDTDGVRKRAGQSISQFSDDGNFFFCCAQDFKVRMYDTSNPYDWKYYKTVDYPFGQWTITDATLSPDNRFLVYSSIRSQAYMATTDPDDDSDPTVLDMSSPVGQNRRRGWGGSHFGIWSLRFSGDGREVVAGTSEDSVIVYDLETRQPVLNLRDRHQHHVNAVCYGDTSSPHILYSGSDDTTIRVWDRRSMGDGREAGAFMGHTEGVTYVDSKGDGRYVLSNSKDQTMKLWDLRKMMTSADMENIDPVDYTTGFDYRFEQYPDQYRRNAKKDCSVVTYRGHRVLKTLIRCHFSPPGSTNSRYVYSGSEDGKVYVYNLDATLADTIDVGQATLNSRPRDPEAYATAYEMSGEMLWRTCVRDASWHPSAPVLAATSWNGWGLSTGTCTVHSWNAGAAKDEGDPPIGKSYDDRLRHIPEFDDYRENASHGRPRRPMRSRPVRRWVGDQESGDAMW
ncbi:uncharacterized protein N7500_010025 [Penicillium coprophilum]|uniref:uncharacterized protein n=1 Tax=Penicillium coprophilum TaxID=36646 RepID=UPI002394079E|nr:uncharacterized protein N7500_010025 [Penicillium coprophilum]KAJ5154586.1 hypothetical protein N7500_010025 [Penicillium coprophilum]